MSALVLPGDIPGLIRKGSPALWLGEPMTVTRLYDDGTAALWQDWGCDVVAPLTEIGLDLTDATGRAHAAWWAMGLDYGHIRPLRAIGSPATACRAVALYGSPQDAGWASASVSGHPVGTIVPALAGLDPDDPRLLPDGSRWVDAEALRLVCLHVAERAP